MAEQQLKFSSIIVTPYFHAIAETFPKFVNISDMVLSNSAQLRLLLPSMFMSPMSMSAGIDHSKRFSAANLRRMSSASGIIQLPAHVLDYLAKDGAITNDIDLSVGLRRISSDHNRRMTILSNKNKSYKSDSIGEWNEEMESQDFDEK
jgi:hypothetical protein